MPPKTAGAETWSRPTPEGRLAGGAARQSPRWAVAERIAEALRTRYGMHLQAVGLHGRLAHGHDGEGCSIELIVVTRGSGLGPTPSARRVDGVIVDLGVIAADMHLSHARTLTTSWPLLADQYISAKPLHDPDGWLPHVRDAHLARLAQADGAAFAALARQAWCRAMSVQGEAQRRYERLDTTVDTSSALLALSEARVAVAVVDGLLTRTYFLDSVDAVRQTGVAGAHVLELAERLRAQSQELARRGRPVDADIDELLG